MTPFEEQTIRAIGGLLVEARQQREAAIEVARAAKELVDTVAAREAALTEQRAEALSADFAQINTRITKALTRLRAAGTDLKAAGTE